MDTGTERSGERPGRRWRELGPLIVAGVALFSLGAFVTSWQAQRFALEAYRIPSSGMEPTLHCPRPASGCEADTADRILVTRLAPFWAPSRGDIVVFRAPEEAFRRCGAGGTFVKRIVGLPGEQVSIRVRGASPSVYVDGERLDEPYVETDGVVGSKTTLRVPEGQYFVLGDNRAQSCDSRVFGSVPRDNLIGPVVARYWPLHRVGPQ